MADGVKMLKITNINDRDQQWDEIIEAVPGADVYYERAYCRAAGLLDEGSAEMFVFKRNGELVVFPFIRLPHPVAGVYDAASPYGYSGPISNVDSKGIWAESAQAFDNYCKDMGIVTTFYRFHPLAATHLNWSLHVQPRFVRHTCFIDLRNRDAIERNMTSNCRNMVRKAERHELRFEIADWSSRGQIFIDLYRKTMQRLAANSWYHFGDRYFEILAEDLSEKPWVCLVCSDGVPCAATLVLRRKPFIHYHLSGWDERYRHVAPNNFLLYQTALHAASDGYKFFHLGGGYSDDDNLFAFKAEFNRNGVRDFYVGEQVHLEHEYALLCARSGSQPSQGGFFPPYRQRR